MSDVSFADVMQRERERLHHERDEISNQQKELERKLTEINRELGAIDAYEAAKAGSVAATRRQRGRGPGASQTSATQLPPEPRPRPRLRSRREALLRVIAENPADLSRGEIFVHLGLKGDKSAEKSVSNALTALTKNNHVARREGKYVIAG
jgi:hypothetical protein